MSETPWEVTVYFEKTSVVLKMNDEAEINFRSFLYTNSDLPFEYRDGARHVLIFRSRIDYVSFTDTRKVTF